MDAIILRHEVQKWLGDNNFIFFEGEIYISAFDETRSMIRWEDNENRIRISFLKKNLNILSNEKISIIKGNKILEESALWKKKFVHEREYICYFDSFSLIRDKILKAYKRDKAFIEYDPELDKYVIQISVEKTDYYCQRCYYVLQSKSFEDFKDFKDSNRTEDQGFIQYISICTFLSFEGSTKSCTINIFLNDEKNPLDINFEKRDLYTNEGDIDNYKISTDPSYNIEILKSFSKEEIYDFFNKNISLDKKETIICHIIQEIIHKLSIFEINKYLK